MPAAVSPFCAQNANRTLINEDNYVLAFDGPPPTRAELDASLNGLPNKRDSSLPPILTFVPRNGLVPNSSRYILGPESLRAFIPELANTKPGFNESAEAQTAEYEVKDTFRQQSARSSRPLLLPHSRDGALARSRIQAAVEHSHQTFRRIGGDGACRRHGFTSRHAVEPH